MIKISLVDKHFSHSKNGYSGDFHPGENIQWSREFPYESNVTVFTGNSLNSTRNKINIAWIIEPYEISPYPYKYILNNWRSFDLVLTYDQEILSIIPNSEFITYGDCWIPEKDCKIYEKSKQISMVCSHKKMTSLQQLRHACLKLENVDYFGIAVNKPIENKLESLKDYKFHIVVENSDRDDFFTEKIIDCLATGTIPIYCGTKNIGKYFNIDGIIQFDTLAELKMIVKKIQNNQIIYENHLSAIQDNFLRFRKYIIKDDIVLEKIQEKGLI